MAAAAEQAGRARLRTPNDSPLKILCLLPAYAWYGIFFVLPLVFLLWIGFWRVENYVNIPDFTIANYVEIGENLFARARYGLALAQSIYVALTNMVFATGFAYLIALALVYAVPARRQRLVLLLTIAPFWSSYVLRLYAWQTILGKAGILNAMLAGIGLEALQVDVIYTQIATRIGLVHYLTPILVVILYVTVRNIDGTLIEAARELGASRWQVFRKVILPLSSFGLMLSASFAVIIALGDTLSPSLLGGGAGESLLGKYPVFSGMLLSDYASSTNLPRTAALATILVAVMVLCLVIGYRLADRARRSISE